MSGRIPNVNQNSAAANKEPTNTAAAIENAGAAARR
jgi:hypothetical protein